MDLLQLEHFVAVVEERTFTRAAERVCRTQPAVSQSIKKLEEEIGSLLFARNMHDVSLTDAGKVLVEHARRILNARDAALREVSALQGLTGGTLTIAAHESAAVYLLPSALRDYVRRFPDIKVGIYRSRLTEIPHRVLDGEVHVGFVNSEPMFRGLQCLEVHVDEMVLIASPNHPLAARVDVRLRDLGTERFVVDHLSSTTEEEILRVFEQHATHRHIVAELWSFENIKNFVQAEVGIAVVPLVTVQRELDEGTLVRFRVPELNIPRRTLMIYRDRGYMSDSARELIKILHSFSWSSGPAMSVVAKPQRIGRPLISRLPAPARRRAAS
jgi:DNA-binding transcriptional LysR family regulator